MHDPRRIHATDQSFPLEQAIADLSRSLCPNGSNDGLDEWSVYDESFRRLVRWSEQRGLFFKGQLPQNPGGREHDVTFEPDTKTWLKFTKPSAAGYVISFDDDCLRLEPALPLPYLARLALQNEVFGDSLTFVGVGGERYRPRVMTRQADVPGRPATNQEICDAMTSIWGFRLLPAHCFVGYQGSLSFVRDDVAVFDLRPANVVRAANGLIIPIDCIPVRLDAHARSVLNL